MRKSVLAATTAAVIGLGAAWQVTAAVFPSIPKWIADAVSDTTRPQEDRDLDAERKPAETLAFTEVKPGETVVDFMPGKGYFTRLFADAVGPQGTVYAFQPSELAKLSKTPLPANGAHPDPNHPNVTVIVGPVNEFAVPTPADIVWTSQNYHDLHDPFMGPADMKVFDTAVYKSLKPGGVFVILDHAALPGSGVSATNTLHRIDPEVVKTEVEAVGFKFVGESDILKNPADPHTALVFDPSIRHHTDQFIFMFRKPR